MQNEILIGHIYRQGTVRFDTIRYDTSTSDNDDARTVRLVIKYFENIILQQLAFILLLFSILHKCIYVYFMNTN